MFDDFAVEDVADREVLEVGALAAMLGIVAAMRLRMRLL